LINRYHDNFALDSAICPAVISCVSLALAVFDFVASLTTEMSLSCSSDMIIHIG